ncbi:hypothetical protein Bca52824_022616 [Brassica carinata]|uniref:Uncharacterized protein n=1 Tax=Brassica carinata TaxID=52824 RepID=A0A8X7VH32_BRACI|nr:hypothetical protein Bca52824_022616 [Brassica carinata]
MFKLCSLDKDLEVFDPNPHNSNVRSLNHNFTGSAEYTSLRCPESSSAESSSGLERRDRNIQDLKQEQEQPSPFSVLERIRLKEETIEEKIRLLSFDDSGMNLLEKDSVHKFVKKVLEASRLNWTNLMARCNEES